MISPIEFSLNKDRLKDLGIETIDDLVKNRRNG